MTNLISNLTNWIKDHSTTVVLACGIIIAVATAISIVATFFSAKQDQEQKNAIEKLATISNELGEINRSLTSKTLELQTLNNELVQNVKSLSVQTNGLVQQVHLLSEENKRILEQVDVRSEDQYLKNAVQGKLNLEFKRKLGEDDEITVFLGDKKVTNPLLFWREVKGGAIQLNGRVNPIKFGFENNELLISTVIYNSRGIWLAELDNNSWRRNTTMISKFNYDENGFEIIDEYNRVAFNINILSGNVAVIQGIFQFPEDGALMIMGQEIKIKGYNDIKSPAEFTDIIKSANIKQLFKYSGENWIGERL